MLGALRKVRPASRYKIEAEPERTPSEKPIVSRSRVRYRSLIYLDNIFARPRYVSNGIPSLDVDCFLVGRTSAARLAKIEIALMSVPAEMI